MKQYHTMNVKTVPSILDSDRCEQIEIVSNISIIFFNLLVKVSNFPKMYISENSKGLSLGIFSNFSLVLWKHRWYSSLSLIQSLSFLTTSSCFWVQTVSYPPQEMQDLQAVIIWLVIWNRKKQTINQQCSYPLYLDWEFKFQTKFMINLSCMMWITELSIEKKHFIFAIQDIEKYYTYFFLKMLKHVSFVSYNSVSIFAYLVNKNNART